MLLSSDEILHYKAHKKIIIHPFVPENVGTNSYDVTLGEYYYKESNYILNQYKNGDIPSRIYNVYDKDYVEKIWSLQAASPAEIMLKGQFLKDPKGIKAKDLVILLNPGETILAHTNEFIGGREFITTEMKARSSFGRNFIEVCKCAGLGDVGYFNRWTMEITNNSRYYVIPLVVGRRIAQIKFYKVGNTFDYAENEDSKYQEEVDLEKLMESWTPEMLLPKLYNDRELRAQSLD